MLVDLKSALSAFPLSLSKFPILGLQSPYKQNFHILFFHLICQHHHHTPTFFSPSTPSHSHGEPDVEAKALATFAKKTPSHRKGEPGMEAKALATFADGLAAEAIQY